MPDPVPPSAPPCRTPHAAPKGVPRMTVLGDAAVFLLIAFAGAAGGAAFFVLTLLFGD